MLQIMVTARWNPSMFDLQAAAMASEGGHGERRHERPASTGGRRGGTGGKKAWEADDKRGLPPDGKRAGARRACEIRHVRTSAFFSVFFMCA